MLYGVISYVKFNNGVLILDKPKRRNDPNSGFSALPGGKLENDEKGSNPNGRLEAVVRETKNETGIIMVKPYLMGTILFDNEGRTFSNWPNPDDYFVYVYGAISHEGSLTNSDEGVPKWTPENEISDLPQNPGDRLMYKWLRKERRFHGVIKHKGNKVDEENTWVDFF